MKQVGNRLSGLEKNPQQGKIIQGNLTDYKNSNVQHKRTAKMD